MGRKKMEDLADFSNWLQKEQFMSASTASTYTSRVRALLAHVKPITSEGLLAYASAPEQVRSLAPTLSGWGHFVTYGAQKGVTIPPLMVEPTPAPQHPMAHTFLALWRGEDGFAEVDEHHLVALRNRDVRMFFASLRGFEVKYGGERFVLSQRRVNEVHAWSGSGEVDDAPFIPAEPNSLSPMTVIDFRRHVRGRRG